MEQNDFVMLMTGRANRAYASSLDKSISIERRIFHAGRAEAYLQAIAVTLGVEVKTIRQTVLGTGVTNTKVKPEEDTRCHICGRYKSEHGGEFPFIESIREAQRRMGRFV